MLDSSCPALVADDQRFAQDLQAHLETILGQAFSLCSFDTVHDHLKSNANALLLVMAVTTRTGCGQALRLAQQMRARSSASVLLVVGGEAEPPGQHFAALVRCVTRPLRWPQDAAVLVAALQEHQAKRQAHAGQGQEAIEEECRRLLRTQTPSLLPLTGQLTMAASHDVTVLLTGETGTGKTYLARLIHQYSPRRSGRLLVVPCGALSPGLVESELFGHAKGAFTGADRPKMGRFEAVGDGTLLLDEVDALPLAQQATLLRVIETGEYEPVGSNQTQQCTARVIAASNWDLEDAVLAGRFRQDLYYRLNVLALHLPPLRDRVQDIAPLARHLAARAAERFGKDLTGIHSEAVAALEAFPWPGNVRQLENAVQQAVLLCPGDELTLEHLPPPVREALAGPIVGCTRAETLAHSRELIERGFIQKILVQSNYNRVRAASALGVSRVTLYKKLKKYNLSERPQRGG